MTSFNMYKDIIDTILEDHKIILSDDMKCSMDMYDKHKNKMDYFNMIYGDDEFDNMDNKCDWTGETVLKVFQIPTSDLLGWEGCYGSPSAAVSGLVSKMSYDRTKSYEDIQEMIDFLEMSIFREEGYEKIKFTIQQAPSKRQLNKMGLNEYHKLYEHEKQIKIFKQVFPYVYFCQTISYV